MPTLFISYKRDDKVAVTKITDRLHKEFYFEIWIDAQSIPGGEPWRIEIRKGIDGADLMVLMLTPDACASKQVKEEVDYANQIGCKILPIQIKKVTDEDKKNLGVQDLQHIDFVGGNDDRSAWEKLLDALPPVLGRDKRLLDPIFKKLHQDYLRTLFVRYSTVSLSQITNLVPQKSVNLMDIYADLFLGFRLYGEIKDNELVYWKVVEDSTATKFYDETNRNPSGNWQVVTTYRIDKTSIEPDTDAKGSKKFRGFEDNTDISTGLALLDEKLKSKVANTEFSDGQHELWRIESEQASVLNSHLVIIGKVGSGKSTLMKYLALCLAGDMLPEAEKSQANLDRLIFWPLPAFTPVFIELKTLMQTTFPDVNANVTLEEFFTYLRNEQLKPHGITNYFDDLHDQMRDGDVMFFLDGLDEVADIDTLERREQIKTLVKLLRGHFPLCRILVTTRPYAYAGDWQLEGFGQVEITPLDIDRLGELALRLFQVELDKREAKQEAVAFITDIQTKVSEELGRNPLLFTLLAALWLNNRSLPVNQRLPVKKSAIFRECIEMLIDRWTRKDFEKGKSLVEVIGLSKVQILNLLEILAFEVHNKGDGKDDTSFEPGLIMTILRRDMKMTKGRINYDTLLEALKNRAEIIYEHNAEQFRFSHLSFQEYLASSYLADSERYPTRAVSLLTQQPQLWRNVLSLLIDQAEDKHLNLWEMITELLPAHDIFQTVESDSKYWDMIYYVGDLLFNHLSINHELQNIYRPRLKKAILRIIELGALSPIDRAASGRWLSELGDSRKGVGLNADGLPDIDWIAIPDGEFIFDRNRKLILPTFKIARYPVTYIQFQAFIDDTNGYSNPVWWQGLAARDVLDTKLADQKIKFANHPRDNVNWYQAIAFCRWLSSKLGFKITLPTEQQWEKAARGMNGLRYPYGDTFDGTMGNTFISGIGQTSAVGLFIDGLSPYGLADMSGNVCEWCLNKFDKSNDVSLGGTEARAISGYSWSDDNSDNNFYAYLHGREYPSYWSNSYGFRLVSY